MKIIDAIMAKADSTIRTNGTGIFTQKFDSTMSGRIVNLGHGAVLVIYPI